MLWEIYKCQRCSHQIECVRHFFSIKPKYSRRDRVRNLFALLYPKMCPYSEKAPMPNYRVNDSPCESCLVKSICLAKAETRLSNLLTLVFPHCSLLKEYLKQDDYVEDIYIDLDHLSEIIYVFNFDLQSEECMFYNVFNKTLYRNQR